MQDHANVEAITTIAPLLEEMAERLEQAAVLLAYARCQLWPGASVSHIEECPQCHARQRQLAGNARIEHLLGQIAAHEERGRP